MTNQEFEIVVKEQCEQIVKTLCRKAKEYASDTDRMHNFNVAKNFLRCSNVYALAGMMTKHIVSVYDIVDNYEKNGTIPTTEMLNEKIGDSINYLILLKAMILEEKNKKEKGEKNV